jgi:iron complex outermembrane receptor protein
LKGKVFEVRRTGFRERDINPYDVNNFKADGALAYKLNEKLELQYGYRYGIGDAVYQRGNRIVLDDYAVNQHRVELRGPRFFVRGYLTAENTGKSYNLRPLGENMDRAFKTDNVWFADYSSRYNKSIDGGASIDQAHDLARMFADSGRYQPGSAEFEAKRKELIGINDWDKGAALVMKNYFYQTEGQYDLSDEFKWAEVLVGGDFRQYSIFPDGNSFINPEQPGENLANKKYGAFVQVTKKLLKDRLKLIGSIRADKADYFDAKFNPRVAAAYTFNGKSTVRASYQNGYRFPTLFEGFSYVNNGGVRRLGGLPLLSEKLQIFENSYVRSSVDAFTRAVQTDINSGGLTQAQAIEKNKGKLIRNTFTYIQPENINAIDLGYRATLLKDKLFVDVDAYYNVYRDFIDQIEVAVPNTKKIGEVDPITGIDSSVYEVYTRTKHERYRMWTNSNSTTSMYGFAIGTSYNFFKSYTITGNLTHNVLNTSKDADVLEAPFNTPNFITNVQFGNREVAKNFGYNIGWRWQNSFEWRSQLANGFVGAYHTIDAQVTYRVPAAFLTAKLGASNLLNNRIYQYVGGPQIGGIYYLALTFDGLLKSKTK